MLTAERSAAASRRMETAVDQCWLDHQVKTKSSENLTIVLVRNGRTKEEEEKECKQDVAGHTPTRGDSGWCVLCSSEQGWIDYPTIRHCEDCDDYRGGTAFGCCCLWDVS